VTFAFEKHCDLETKVTATQGHWNW